MVLVVAIANDGGQILPCGDQTSLEAGKVEHSSTKRASARTAFVAPFLDRLLGIIDVKLFGQDLAREC